MVNVNSQVLFKPLIRVLCLLIGLQMISSAHIFGDSKLLAQFFEKMRCKPCIVIRNDFSEDLIVWEDVLGIQPGYVFFGGSLAIREKECCLADIMIHYCENRIKAL